MTVTHAEASPSTEEAVRPFAELRREDVDYAGGKGANLGELTSAGLPVPDGFVVGAPAYAAFLVQTGLRERLAQLLDVVDVEDTAALQVASAAAQELVSQTPVPEPLAREIRVAYEQLAHDDPQTPVAVRSSATAEDTAATSFAGMNETFLNIRGADGVIDAVRRCWRSLFGARTIYYRGVNGFAQADMDIAVVVQRQVNSTRAGVMFTVNPATGQRDELVIEGSFGLGEAVVSGSVSPDRYVVEKATLAIRRREVHHKELVIEYAARRRHPPARSLRGGGAAAGAERRGGRCRRRARPADRAALRLPTGHRVGLRPRRQRCGCCRAARSPLSTMRACAQMPRADGDRRSPRPCCCTGSAAHRAAPAARRGCCVSLADAASLNDGDVLVTHMTSPDWLPLIRRAGAIVTDSGGMTCHAAIVSRELGIPCVVGTGEATKQATRRRDRDRQRHPRRRLGGCPRDPPAPAIPRPTAPGGRSAGASAGAISAALR